jgi:tetratricopeptide (TPR) repeat protein
VAATDRVALPDLISLAQDPMPTSPEIHRLATLWRETGQPTAFAALADALRKAGEAETAWGVVLQGTTRYPGFVPGRLVQAALLTDRGALAAAETVLREARGVDPSHPLVEAALEGLAMMGDGPGDRVRTPVPVGLGTPLPEGTDLSEPFDDGFLEEPFAADEVLSESLAALYLRQGHLEQAEAAYSALTERDPDNLELATRYAEVVAEVAARRPMPYGAAESGGRPVGEWLADIAAARPEGVAPTAGYDAFYQAPAAPPEATTDYASFERWLKGLGG